jgi:hypothetical protein
MIQRRIPRLRLVLRAWALGRRLRGGEAALPFSALPALPSLELPSGFALGGPHRLWMRRQLGVRPSVAGEVAVGLCSAESSVISMPSGGTLGSDARLSFGRRRRRQTEHIHHGKRNAALADRNSNPDHRPDRASVASLISIPSIVARLTCSAEHALRVSADCFQARALTILDRVKEKVRRRGFDSDRLAQSPAAT